MNNSMQPEFKFRSNLLFSFSLCLICFIFLMACGNAKVTKKESTPKNENVMVRGKQVGEKESYSHIVNSVARLKAMMCGVFVHHNRNGDPERKKYSTWMVNDKKDSVMIYTIPVGEPNKIGYWIYTYQIMTSLPEEPIYESFAQFKEINRDTIKCIYYEAPSDFNPSLETILQNSKTIFDGIDLGRLDLHPKDEILHYTKQSPTHYIATSKMTIVPEKKGSVVVYSSSFQDIKTNRISFGRQGYDKDRKYVGKLPPDYLMKIAMIRSDQRPK